ncbi:alpha/beta hydrolase [Castellaniella caeni]|uniref:alpha/beta hydrolase n=1 Tax=Castellaniella caeni TaxID=266123 RepID=UPI00082F83EC|nr:alpha/beta hydrolase-fold protein [Castellaniella caeni]
MTAFSTEFTLSRTDGRPCVVRLAVPVGPVPPGGWPVAYVLDQSQFDTMCLTAGPHGLPGLLVGLAPQVPAQRVWDYVPLRWPGAASPPEEAALAPAARPPGYVAPGQPPAGLCAGAACWLRVLDRVRARLAADFPLHPARQVLAGHSLGALFALYVLLHRPGTFDGYVLSSPSVWWGGGYARRLVRRRLAWLVRQGLPSLGLALSVGEFEQSLSPEEADLDPEARAQQLLKRQRRAMVDGVGALAADLAVAPGLRLRHTVLPGHVHRTAPQDALLPGWRWLLAGDAAR